MIKTRLISALVLAHLTLSAQPIVAQEPPSGSTEGAQPEMAGQPDNPPPPSHTGPVPPDTEPPQDLGQDAAVAAVTSNQAMALDEILSLNAVMDQVVGASLLRAGSFLLYKVRLLSHDGQLSELYFYARTGLPVENR